MWNLFDRALESRILLGTALYPSPEIMKDAIRASGSEVVTVSLRRQSPQEEAGARFWSMIQGIGVAVLPNTAGCRTRKEAVTTARMARDLFETDWIKLEVIADDYTLRPDTDGLVEAAEELSRDGFKVLPYTTEDVDVAQRLVDSGCRVIMPWGSMIGSGQGLTHPGKLRQLRERFPDIPLIIDAGLGKPSDAAQAMEMGFDGILLNSAVALADDPVAMAHAFALATRGGRQGYEAGLMVTRNLASPSTPTLGTPFWHQEKQGV